VNSGGIASLFLVGLLGTVHCLGMCGGIVAALSVRAPGIPPASSRWLPIAYHAGRLTTYSAAGALAGGVGSAALLLKDFFPVQAALYVAALKAGQRSRSGSRGRRHEHAILNEIAEIADQYDQDVATAVRADAAPNDAVVAEIERRRHNIVVMGVGRRPGDKLFFGETAAGVFEKSPATVVFVAS